MSISYLNPMDLAVSTPKEATGLISYTINNESYFLETLKFVSEINAEYNAETRNFYRAIAESENDAQIINESFSSFFAAVKKLIDKFIAFIKRLVQKFITHLNGIVKSDKYLIKHKDDFKKFNTKNEFSFEGYNYTFNNAVPVINALAEFEGEDTFYGTPSKDFFDLFGSDLKDKNITKEKADKIAEKIAEKYQELTDSLNGDYYDIFRAKVLNKEKDFIPQEDFAAECFAVFRNDNSDKEIIDVDSSYVTKTYLSFIGNEKFYKEVEKDKKRIEKDYTDIKNRIDKLISANYDKKLSSVIELPNGGIIESSKAQELLHQFDLFVKAKSVQVQEMCNIHALAFSAKLDAIKESYNQDKVVLYKALSKIQGTVQEESMIMENSGITISEYRRAKNDIISIYNKLIEKTNSMGKSGSVFDKLKTTSNKKEIYPIHDSDMIIDELKNNVPLEFAHKNRVRLTLDFANVTNYNENEVERLIGIFSSIIPTKYTSGPVIMQIKYRSYSNDITSVLSLVIDNSTISESIIMSDDTIENDLFNDYLDPVDDQEIIDAIIDGKIGMYDTIAMVQEAMVYNEALGQFKDPEKFKTVAQCNKAIGKAQIKLDKFESNYSWWKGLTKEEQKKEINKKRFERFALFGLSYLVGVIPFYAKYISDINNGELPADITTNPDAFYRSNIAAIKGLIDDLEKRKKELSEMNMNKDDYSYENEMANFLFLQERAIDQYMLEKAIAEAIVVAEGTDVYNKIVSLNEGAFDKIKSGFKKIIEFIKGIFAKFVAKMDEMFKKDAEYLKKYKEIILNKPLKPATYTMPNYPNGIKNLTSVKVPYFNYEQMKDEWLVDDAKFCEKVFQGKSPAPLASQNFTENCKMMFRGSEKDIDFKHDQLSMTDIYNYCLEFDKMKKIIENDQKTIINSGMAIDKLIDQLESEYGQTGNAATSSTSEPAATASAGSTEGEAKKESVYSFLYGTYITEDEKADGKMQIKPTAAPGGTTAAGATQNIDKDTTADNKESLQKNAGNKSELEEIRKKLSVYSSCCSTLFSTKLSIAEEIRKNYMLIITNHVKNYVGSADKSTKTKDAQTDYSNNGEKKPAEGNGEAPKNNETQPKQSIKNRVTNAFKRNKK